MNRTFSDVSGKEIKTSYEIAVHVYDDDGDEVVSLSWDVTKAEQQRIIRQIKAMFKN